MLTTLSVVGGVATSGTAAARIGEARVGHYTLNNLQGKGKHKTKVHDASPEKNHGTNHGAEVGNGGGKVGNAFAFDGDAWIAVPGFPNLNSSLTIAAWVNTNDPAEKGQRVFADDETNTGGYALSLGDNGTGTVRFYNRRKDTVKLDTENSITADTWHHVAGVYDDDDETRYIYVDANQEAKIDDDTGPGGEQITERPASAVKLIPQKPIDDSTGS